MINFSCRVTVPETVLFRELDGESVLLNLGTESYLGLNEVGTRMWSALTTSSTIQAAYDELQTEYDVAPEVLRQDMETLLGQMLEHGLVQIVES